MSEDFSVLRFSNSIEITGRKVSLIKEGGHDVPVDRIEKRYVRSMQLIKEAADIAYQGYFFDNSINDEPYRLVGHFKVIAGEKEWDAIAEDQVAI